MRTKTNVVPGSLFVVLAFAAGCGDDGAPAPAAPGRFGEVTTAVVIVNPIINRGSTTSINPASRRADLEVKAADLSPIRTDTTGLAVIEGLPTGTVPIRLDSGSVTLQVVNPKELYDVVLAYRQDAVEHVIEPVRYPIGDRVVVLEPGRNIAEAAVNDGTIVRLKAGSYPGGIELRAEGVLIFGEWSLKDGPRSVIEGDVRVLGGNIRMRGLRITGQLTSNANTFSAAFCDVGTASITGNGVSLIRNRFTAGRATVPSSAAILVDNAGIP